MFEIMSAEDLKLFGPPPGTKVVGAFKVSEQETPVSSQACCCQHGNHAAGFVPVDKPGLNEFGPDEDAKKEAIINANTDRDNGRIAAMKNGYKTDPRKVLTRTFGALAIVLIPAAILINGCSSDSEQGSSQPPVLSPPPSSPTQYGLTETSTVNILESGGSVVIEKCILTGARTISVPAPTTAQAITKRIDKINQSAYTQACSNASEYIVKLLNRSTFDSGKAKIPNIDYIP